MLNTSGMYHLPLILVDGEYALLLYLLAAFAVALLFFKGCKGGWANFLVFTVGASFGALYVNAIYNHSYRDYKMLTKSIALVPDLATYMQDARYMLPGKGPKDCPPVSSPEFIRMPRQAAILCFQDAMLVKDGLSPYTYNEITKEEQHDERTQERQ